MWEYGKFQNLTIMKLEVDMHMSTMVPAIDHMPTVM